MEVLIWVIAVTGALASSLIGSLFLTAAIQNVLHRAHGASLAIKVKDEEAFELWEAELKRLDTAIGTCFWLSTVFYGIAIYLVWGI
jgi:hypothetical protein